jgi:arylsulfatase A-like enzyme
MAICTGTGCHHSLQDLAVANAIDSVNTRPNIIFLLADDMRYDALGCTGNKIAITPSLDKLAQQGTDFRNSYVTSAICAISRASIFTGQYAIRHGIDDFDKCFPAHEWQSTYPYLLRSHGYYTGFIGKYGVGNKMPSKEFDYWKGFPGHGVYFYTDAKGNKVHETAMMGNEAKEFIAKRDKSKPFCLSISFKAPHSEDGITENNGFRPDPYFNNWYSNVEFTYPETYSDSFYYKFPAGWRRNSSNIENEGRARRDYRFSPAQFQTTYHAIYRLVSGVDKVVGELRDYLAANNLDKNTIIVFTSDNGYYMGEHGLEGKWYGHEESIRVPLIIYDPRMPQQRKIVEEMALNIDIAPTILSWADISVPATVQGKPLQPLLTSKPANWRTEFFYEHPYLPGEGMYIPKSEGVVTQSWKYIMYYNGSIEHKHPVYQELFDVSSDPHEKINHLADPGEKIRLKELRSKMRKYEAELR